MRSTSLLPSPCQDKVGHRRKMISELNTRPGCASVNASPEQLPVPTHHSRPRRLARSYLVRLFHSQLSSGLCRRTPSPLLAPRSIKQPGLAGPCGRLLVLKGALPISDLCRVPRCLTPFPRFIVLCYSR